MNGMLTRPIAFDHGALLAYLSVIESITILNAINSVPLLALNLRSNLGL